MVSPQDARGASAFRIVTGGTEQTAPAADEQLLASHVVGRLEAMLRRFEPGAPPPVGARELLQELHDALAGGHLGQGRLSPDRWDAARAIAATGLESLEDDRAEPARFSGWTADGPDYVTANSNGITEHVHVIEDTGHFTTPTRAAVVFSLSVVLDQNGRQIDTCDTGTIHWTARAS